MIADARINASASARLVLDTGADRTLISPRALAAAGVSLSRTVAMGKIVGVTGTDRLPYVMIESLEVGGARVGRMPVGAYDVAEADADGLLGRDVLDRFNIAIDAAQGLITLSPK
jgi:predicted aspartyl protease